MARPERFELPTTWFEASNIKYNFFILQLILSSVPATNALQSITMHYDPYKIPTMEAGVNSQLN